MEYAERYKLDELLEAKFVVLSNDVFHQLCNNSREKKGFIDSKRVFFEWEGWLKKEIKRKEPF